MKIHGKQHKIDLSVDGITFAPDGNCPINVELTEGESMQLLVPASMGRTCVHLTIMGGKLSISGGASIIDSIEGDGMSALIVETEVCDPTSASIDKMGNLRGSMKAELVKDGLLTAGDLAKCSFDYVEAKYGLEFATRVAGWLRTLDLSMKV